MPVIALAAFAVRFAVSCELIRNDPATWSPSPITDMKTYLDLADGILRGVFPRNFYYQPFYYAVFLPLCRLAGGVWLLAQAQSALGGASVWLAGLCAQLTAGRKAGICAALLAALCAISIYFTPYALLEVLQAFWIVLLLYLTLRLWRRPSAKLWCIAGLVLGCAILTRGNCWCFLPVLLCAAFRKAGWKNFALRSALLIAFAVLPQLPFALYNTVRNERLCGPSTAGGAVLAFGNNPEGAPAGLEIPYPKTYELWLSREKEISVPRRMWQWFRDEPAAFLEQQLEKCFLFWDAADYPNNITEANAQRSWLMRTFRFLPAGALLALGLAGVLAGFFRRYFLRRKSFLLTAGFIVLYALSISAFYILSRFRVPILPVLAVSGGVFLARLFRRGPFGVRVRLIGVGAVAVFFVYGFMPLYSFAYEPMMMTAVRTYGVQTEFETSPYEWPAQPGGPYLLIADHASALKGGWLGAGNRFTAVKRFRPKRLPRGDRALLALPTAGGEGAVTLTVNGERCRAAVRNNLILAEVPVRSRDGFLVLDIALSDPLCTSGEWTCALDSRRDYGRTVLDGKPAPYELVSFLILPVER
ncbi:MAG: glycosyltransferase family 39 protein [Lentisphaeria bacterium]|nr:glycosyltransferase family 39 protein [Lentisphaeria bacterium]